MMLSGGGEETSVDLLARTVAQLAQRFETVQIFVSRYNAKATDGKAAGVTEHLVGGAGNWYARYGQVKEWSKVHEKVALEKAIASLGEDEDDDEDDDESDWTSN